MTHSNGSDAKSRAREIALKILSHVMDTGGDFPIDEMLEAIISESGLLKALEASAPGRDWPRYSEMINHFSVPSQDSEFIAGLGAAYDYLIKYRKPVVSDAEIEALAEKYVKENGDDFQIMYNVVDKANRTLGRTDAELQALRKVATAAREIQKRLSHIAAGDFAIYATDFNVNTTVSDLAKALAELDDLEGGE